MTSDPLYEPLGVGPTEPKERKRVAAPVIGTFVAAVAVVIGAAVLARSFHHPDDGPSVVATIAPLPKVPPAESPAAAPPLPTATAVPGAPQGIVVQPNGDTVEVQNGVKIIRLGPASRSGLVVMPPATVPAPTPSGPDSNLLERSGFGELPRISPDGLRPSEAYAGQSAPVPPGMPRLALLIGGMGANPQATATAVRQVPAAVSMAFAPNGADLQSQAAQARAAGHEIILEVPMGSESQGPTPAPHALTATGGSANLDALHWAMGRFAGYAGTASDRGASFLATPAAVPVLRDIASRGLFFVADVPASGDQVDTVAATIGLSTVTADLSIDGSADAATLKSTLDRLAEIARSKGRALGYIRRPPADLGPVIAFAKELGSRGVVLVPVSAVAVAPAKAADGRSP